MKTQQLFINLGYSGAIEFLKAEPRNIQVKEYDDFVVLNYNQIFSQEDDEYVMECRSLQIARDGTIISRAFPRFFNFGQRPEITGNFIFDSNTSFLEKADGSLIRVYWNPYANQWECATRGTAFAESEQAFYPTFREAIITDGFGFADEAEFQQFFNRECTYVKSNTYVFEYCSLKNNIVTPYETPQMVLLAVIDNDTGREWAYNHTRYYLYDRGWMTNSCPNIRQVKRYQFDSYEEMKEALDNLPDLQEGFVAQDSTGLRVKFKNDLYLKLHKMRGDLGFTEKKIAEVVADGEEEEVLTYFGQYKHLFNPIVEARETLFAEILSIWGQTCHITDKKEFALKVKDLTYSAMLFTMKNKDVPFSQAWEDARLEYKVNLILEKNNASI